MKRNEIVETAKSFLLSQIKDGLCREFFQLRHGPSDAWVTACVGSTLAEFKAVPPETLEAILGRQWSEGGWSYNQRVMPDADSTLRALQFLRKIGFRDEAVISRAEDFVAVHQRPDGGIATFRPATVARLGYPEGGWTESQPCVTALAANILSLESVRQKAKEYVRQRLIRGDARAYWWRTPWYVLYEAGHLQTAAITSDPVEISLCLLLKAKQGLADPERLSLLESFQLADGSFPVSRLFRLPRPEQTLADITGQEEIVVDRTRIFSTSAAVIAIARQQALLN